MVRATEDPIAPNTLRGYRSDWAEFTAWCARLPRDPLPAAADTISAYLTELARAGAKVGTMSRRLSSIRFAHQLRDLPDPATGARVVAVWEGIRRTHGAPPDQAAPLMPPALFDVLDHCPQTKVLGVDGTFNALQRNEKLRWLDVHRGLEAQRQLVVASGEGAVLLEQVDTALQPQPFT
jgi:hypothetical protein